MDKADHVCGKRPGERSLGCRFRHELPLENSSRSCHEHGAREWWCDLFLWCEVPQLRHNRRERERLRLWFSLFYIRPLLVTNP